MAQDLMDFIYPYVHVTFHEYSNDGRFERSDDFAAIERYLAGNSVDRSRKLKANSIKGSETLVFSMEDGEEIMDEFQDINVWWSSSHKIPQRQVITFFSGNEEKRFYCLKFHMKNRELVTTRYIKHVVNEGKAIGIRTRQRKLYTNCRREGRVGGGDCNMQRMWNHVKFVHPASFDTLAMEANKKKDIRDDLTKFSRSKNYYSKIGKAWKRGYLLYGPPGTGKSSLIAAMANHLEYDVYDLELTAVKDNTELRRLLMGVSGKSIMVIEDIDCSLDLTGRRKKKTESKKEKEKEKEKEKDPVSKMTKQDDKDSKVTLSGLLNFIDGLWSACGEERIIVLTTNYVEKLDPALIRSGRMDKHIELSYCGFEAFKVLAKNYMDIDSHPLFTIIEEKLEEINMTPADVAENLMAKSEEDDVDSRLEDLIHALNNLSTKEVEGGGRRGKRKQKKGEEEVTRRRIRSRT